MPKIIKSQWKPADDNVMIAQFGPSNGALQLLVDKYPAYTYERFGNYLCGTDGDFISIFEHQPGTTRGYAGRETVLDMVDGTTETFKGSLWSPGRVANENIPRFCTVNITTEPDVMERGFTFYSACVKLGRYVELRVKSGFPVALGDL